MLPRSLESIVRLVFRAENDERELGDEPYIAFLCDRIARAREPGRASSSTCRRAT